MSTASIISIFSTQVAPSEEGKVTRTYNQTLLECDVHTVKPCLQRLL